MIPYIGHFNEVLFPGFTATAFGLAGLVVGLRQAGRQRETAIVYGTLGALALWASFGPLAGLYRVFYNTIPLFAGGQKHLRETIMRIVTDSRMPGEAKDPDSSSLFTIFRT